METSTLLQDYLGEFGRFQIFTFFLIVFLSPNEGATLCAMTFLMATPGHHCRVHENGCSGDCGLSTENLNNSIPLENLDGRRVYSSCLKYRVRNETAILSNRSTMPCDHGWQYDQSYYHTTVVTEYDLVCERAWMVEMGQFIFFAGVSLGGILAGIAADRFGRRPTTLMCMLLHLVFGVGAAFTTDYVTFAILRSVVGGVANGFFFSAIVIGVEIVGPSKRNAVGMAGTISASFGFIILGFLAYFLRDWWTLQLVQALMTAPFLCYWWFLPESPRWLLTVNRVDEAKVIIKRAAIINKTVIKDDDFDALTEKLVEKGKDFRQHGLLDLFRKPRLRKITIALCFVWFSGVCVYFGLLLGSVELSGDPYLNFTLGACLEVGLAILAYVVVERWGRKPVVGGGLLLAGVGCMVSAITRGLPSVSRGFALMGRGGIGITFASLIAYSPEVFPTVVRSMGVGLANMCCRLGSALTPFVSLLGDVWQPLPMITFGVMCFVAILAVSTLPETLGVTLPDTLDDCENLGRKQPQSDDMITYTTPSPVPAPMKYMRRVVVCYQAARDGAFFSSALIPTSR